MIKPINILAKGGQIYLREGYYDLNVLGGSMINLNNFSVKFHSVEGDGLVRLEESFWKIRSNSKAIRIATFEVLKSGKYEIEFINPLELKLKRSNIFILSIFQDYVPAEIISIGIESKF